MLVPTGRPLKQCVGLTSIYKTDQAYSGRPKNGTAHRTALLPLVIAELRRIKPDQLAENSLVFIADPFQGKVRLNGIDFDENFLLELVARHFRRQQWQAKPMFSDAYDIYMRRNPSAHRSKFKTVARVSCRALWRPSPWSTCARSKRTYSAT